MRFTYFVIFAEMRTGSNFLEASLNSFDDLHCYGEAFNPNFVGHHNRSELFGMDLAQRETAPLALIEKMKTQTDGLPGSDAKQRREAKITFDLPEFLTQLDEKRSFQRALLKGMQTSGQTGFYIAYEDIGDVDVLNGLAAFLGSDHQIAAAAKSTKKQNPSDLSEKVSNYAEMVTALGSVDHFNLNSTPNFEPRRGPAVPGFYTGVTTPLLFIPVGSGPKDEVLNWLAALDDAQAGDLPTGLSQKDLRQWKKAHPGHRSFSVLRHPLARAHHAFCTRILPKADDNYQDLRRVLSKKYGVDFPLNGDLSDYSVSDHAAAFTQFVKFLKSNLAGQTSLRVDAAWATQSAQLEAAAQVVLPDVVIREEEAQAQLSSLTKTLGLKSPVLKPARADMPYQLEQIYSSQLEKLCFQTYRKDYINFGFTDWSKD